MVARQIELDGELNICHPPRGVCLIKSRQYSVVKVKPMSLIDEYHGKYADIPGFFDINDLFVWEFLFELQNEIAEPGGFLELGVYRGKSALFGAMNMKPDDQVCLIDCSGDAVNLVLSMIAEFHPDNNMGFGVWSRSLLRERALLEYVHKFRFVHIDGDHTGYSARNDMEALKDMVSEYGILVMDDFMNPCYPQLTAAIYDFLFKNQFEWKMVMNAGGKCYLVRAHAHEIYDRLIREKLAARLEDRDWPLTLRRTSFAHDFGCFSLVAPDPTGRKLVGMDSDIDMVPY